MDDKVSVIVPVYNVEKYLEKCLISLVNQTYTNLEILIVDDGSEDGSADIYNKYKCIDQRIKIIYKENGGLSEARNIGIRSATGEYICCVDSDDYVENDYVEKMVQQIVYLNADICCCGKIIENGNKVKYINCEKNFVINSKEALKLYLLKNEIDNSSVDKICRKKLYDQIEFPVGKYYEDIGTIYKLILKANKVVHINNPLYHYVMREGSITHEEYSEKQLDSLYMTKEAIKNIENVYPDLHEYTVAYYALEIASTIRRLYQFYGARKMEDKYWNIIEEYQENYEEFIKNPYLPRGKKIMIYLLRYRFYRIVDIVYKILGK